MAISMLKIRRPLGRLIFNMGIAIPGKTVFLIETAPWMPPVVKPNSRQQEGQGKQLNSTETKQGMSLHTNAEVTHNASDVCY